MQKRSDVDGVEPQEKVKCWRRKWCWVYRQFGENRKVIRWRPMCERNCQSKWGVSRSYDQIENVVFVMVGKLTCWVRLKQDRRDRKWEVKWSVGLSRWMLKSPVMMNSWGVVAAMERNETLNTAWRRWIKTEDGRCWKQISLNEEVAEWWQMT